MPLRLPLFAFTLLISAVALLRPAFGQSMLAPGADKIGHLVLFTLLALTGRWARLPVGPLAGGLVCYALGTEVLQGVLPIDRQADVWDGLVDVVGIGLGLALARRWP